MRGIHAAMLAVVLFGASGRLSEGQFAPQTVPQNPNAPPGMGKNNEEPALPPGTAERLELARQSDRQKKLMADTDKLLALATQLKADVSKTNKDILSIDVIKRADEIEKLAHSVKERMKG